MRLAWAALLALFLVLHLLASAGCMPALEKGRPTIILCPDGGWAVPASAMAGTASRHHGSKQMGHPHQTCPYAAAAATPLASADGPLLPILVLLGFSLFVPGASTAPAHSLRRQRPPSTGPPLLA